AGRGLPHLGLSEEFHRWRDGVIRYVYNPTGAPELFADPAHVSGLLGRAFGEWEGVSGVRFQFLGVDAGAALADRFDGVVVVGWEAGPYSAQASTYSYCQPWEAWEAGYCPFTDGAIRFHPLAGWDQGDREFTERGFAATGVHEIGHLIGLGHSDDPNSVLYADPYNHLHHPRPDDIEAAQALYGPPAQLVSAPGYAPPAPGATSLGPTRLSIDFAQGPSVAEVGPDTPGDWLAAHVPVAGGVPGEVRLVVVDPEGHFHRGQVLALACGAQYAYCTRAATVAELATVKTLPGPWRVHAIADGFLAASHTVEVLAGPVWNRPPEATLILEPTLGAAPLRVDATLTVHSDPEGDRVGVVWHLPTVGESRDDLGGATGQSSRAFTLTAPGRYEVYVEVTDDGPRYGAAGSGSAAGRGFRRLFRRVVTVGEATAPAYYRWAVPGGAAMGLAGTLRVEGAAPPPGTEVGVFDSRGELRGAAAVDEDGAYRLQVSGDGLAAGEALALRVYLPGRGQASGDRALALSTGGALPAFTAAAHHGVDVDVRWVPHQADYRPADLAIGLSELLRVIQLYNTGAYGCDPRSEDGYAPGAGSRSCTPHTGDYEGPDWRLGLSELLRAIQLCNSGGYHPCAEGEDGFCPGR
ncbi:MAG: matrixin family metalloprotease, partial [Deferrisomatales bacterium]